MNSELEQVDVSVARSPHADQQDRGDSSRAKELEVALKLHDAIYEDCRQQNVDRFQKYNVQDNLSATAVHRIKSREGKRVPARFSIGYWKAWTDTRDILEHKSEQFKKTEQTMALFASKKKTSKAPYSTYRRKQKSIREKVKGVAFGPPNAVMPSLYVRSDPGFQLPVEELFVEQTKKPLPKDPIMLPKPLDVPVFKGGNIPGGPPRPKVVQPVTWQCDVKSADELLGPIFKKPVSFTNAARFKKDRHASKLGAYAGPDELKTESYQGRFSKSERLAGSDLHTALHATPGPQEYTVPGIFDKTAAVPTEEMKTRRLVTLKQQRTLRDNSSTELARLVTFGFGCNMEEHRKYGLCLDGMCGRRGRTEDVILLTNKDELFRGELDESRLRHTQEKKNRKFASPMQAAIISGDFNRVSNLINLGYNINEIDPVTKRSAIHEAVSRGYIKLVAELCAAYAVESADHSVHKMPPPIANTTGTNEDPIGSSPTASTDDISIASTTSNGGDILGIYASKRDLKVMRLDLVDSAGDSVFHYCARQGHQEILENLCDRAVRLIDVPNHKGEYPSDIAKTHVLFQLISIGNDRIKLENQLRNIKKEKRSMSRSHPNRLSSPEEIQRFPRKSKEGDASEGGESGSGSDHCTKSDENDEESDIFFDTDKTIKNNRSFSKSGSFSRSGSFSQLIGKEEVFSKFRRHSFRVGFFADEDTAGNDNEISRAETM